MRKLMLSTAVVMPLMMGQAFAQDTATTPVPAEPATDTTMGSDTAPAAEVPAGENTEAAAEGAAEAELAASGKVEQQQAENELRIDWITDATVTSPDGNAIGDINDVIVDADAGTMKAAVIGVGGFLGIGEKQIAVPWDQLTINHDAQQITSDLTQEEAEAAPEYVFREQQAAPDTMGAGGTAGGGMATDSTMTATPDSAATMTTDPATTTTTDPAMTGGDAGTVTTTEPAMSGTDSATTTTAEPMEAPADTAETPATPPADAGAMEPAEPEGGAAPATN